jgi:hypothetical protein
MTWGGGLGCQSKIDTDWDELTDGDALTLFELNAYNKFSLANGATLSLRDPGAVLEIHPADDNIDLDAATIQTAATGDFILNGDFDVSLDNASTINSNVHWFIDRLNVSADSTLSANQVGCRSSYVEDLTIPQADGYGPNDSNICVSPTDGGVGGALDNEDLISGTGGAGYGGAGGAGTTDSGGSTYGSEFRPLQYGSGAGSAGPHDTAGNSTAWGGSGGGTVVVQADQGMDLNGTIEAVGQDGSEARATDASVDRAAGGGSCFATI